MRKDILEGVEIYVINEIKPNYAALAQKYDCDYRTVKSAYEKAKLRKTNQYTQLRKQRSSKLDPYKAIVEEKLKQHCSAYSIFTFIQKKGFQGSYTLVKNYCRNYKQEKIKKATIRVEHQPGLSAQVDWKENMKLTTSDGEIIEFNIFLYVLPYSKKKYFTLTFDRKHDTLFECLYKAFQYTGGVPKEIWFDNMRTVVDHSRTQYAKVQFNERFYAFSKDANFIPVACRPFRPQTKGCVEALARSVDRLLVYLANQESYSYFGKHLPKKLVEKAILLYSINQSTGDVRIAPLVYSKETASYQYTEDNQYLLEQRYLYLPFVMEVEKERLLNAAYPSSK
ncbi:IS21 family transposase [Enterococcus italicus]|uniref:IS21 family transposase n=1 Tax=Enterococcus italicus TaxID=246144 RepID=UPI0023EF0B7B|nr:IS21 family transposase [Enterococcus italicus]